MQNVLSREFCAFCTLPTFYRVNFLDLFYPDGAMRYTAKSNKRRKRWIEGSTHMQEIEIIDSQKFPKSFQSYLGNSNNKTNLVKQLF